MDLNHTRLPIPPYPQILFSLGATVIIIAGRSQIVKIKLQKKFLPDTLRLPQPYTLKIPGDSVEEVRRQPIPRPAAFLLQTRFLERV